MITRVELARFVARCVDALPTVDEEGGSTALPPGVPARSELLTMADELVRDEARDAREEARAGRPRSGSRARHPHRRRFVARAAAQLYVALCESDRVERLTCVTASMRRRVSSRRRRRGDSPSGCET